MSKVPHLRFDTADFPAAERFDRYRAVVSHYDVTLPDDAAPQEFQVEADAWMLGSIVASSSRLSAMRLVRSAGKASADGRDSFVLVVLRRGGWNGDVDGRLLTAGPGRVVMFDLTRPFEVIATANDCISLDVARAPLAATAPPGVDLHGLVFDGAAGRVLADQMTLLRRRLPSMDESEAPDAVDATLGLLRGCIAVASQPHQQDLPRRDLEILHRVSRYIDQNLADPDLSVATICREAGVSRSVLYRVFAPLSGVADYIRARRLEAIHVLLEDAGEDRWSSEIAAEFGFVSQAHFSRSFRQRYGYAPRAARDSEARFRELAAVVDAHAVADVFQAWIAQIR